MEEKYDDVSSFDDSTLMPIADETICKGENAQELTENDAQNLNDEGADNENSETNQKVFTLEKQQELDKLLADEISDLSQKFANAPKNLIELTQLPEKEQIAEFLQRGFTISEAYSAACAARLLQDAHSAAKQEAISGIYSKSHLAPFGGSVADEVHVPADVMEVYRKMFPKMKDAEIRAEYKKQGDN